MNYLSAHLFYEDLNVLLKKAVFPFVELRIQNKLFQNYFFIRYSEGGKHIRLRMLTSQEEKLKAFTTTYFNQFFIEKPSTRAIQDQNLYPNNSIQYINYKPEIERYGGEKLIKVAEQHFHISSETVRQLITYFDVWDNELAVGISLQVQVMFAHALGFSSEEARRFFENYYNNWLFVFDEQTRHSKAFQAQFEISQHQSTIDFVKSLWLELEENADFGNAFLKDWYIKTQTIAKKIAAQTPKQRFSIYESLLHMTNNRLGISNYDEVLLAFVLQFMEIEK